MTSKYDCLADHLAASGAAIITLTFAEIEAATGPLPDEARFLCGMVGHDPLRALHQCACTQMVARRVRCRPPRQPPEGDSLGGWRGDLLPRITTGNPPPSGPVVFCRMSPPSTLIRERSGARGRERAHHLTVRSPLPWGCGPGVAAKSKACAALRLHDLAGVCPGPQHGGPTVRNAPPHVAK